MSSPALAKSPTAKFPTRLQIGPISYKIFKNLEKITKAQNDDEYLYGICELEDSTIVIRPNMGDREPVTLLHEVLHAVWHESGLRGFAEDEEEVIVHAISSHLLDTFKRNKGLIEYLTASV